MEAGRAGTWLGWGNVSGVVRVRLDVDQLVGETVRLCGRSLLTSEFCSCDQVVR